MNNKFDLKETLKKEQELLLEKISKARENGDAGSYKNLIVALRDITRLIHDEEYENKEREISTIQKLGVSVKDKEGNFRTFESVMGDLIVMYRDIPEDAKKELIDVFMNIECVDRGLELLNRKGIKYFSIDKIEDGNYFMFIQQQDENDVIIQSEFSKITELKDYSFDLKNNELTLKLQVEPTDEEFGRVRVIPKHTHEFKEN